MVNVAMIADEAVMLIVLSLICVKKRLPPGCSTSTVSLALGWLSRYTANPALPQLSVSPAPLS